MRAAGRTCTVGPGATASRSPKDYYRTDDFFASADRLEISEETFRRIVKELERFDLSKTGDNVKGLAFEKFLGSTFQGELGQFFTPRPVVDFMVNLLDPREGDLICDPAAGSGGFLIRAFEHVRGRIAANVQAEKDRARAEIEARALPLRRSPGSMQPSQRSTGSFARHHEGGVGLSVA